MRTRQRWYRMQRVQNPTWLRNELLSLYAICVPFRCTDVFTSHAVTIRLMESANRMVVEYTPLCRRATTEEEILDYGWKSAAIVANESSAFPGLLLSSLFAKPLWVALVNVPICCTLYAAKLVQREKWPNFCKVNVSNSECELEHLDEPFRRKGKNAEEMKPQRYRLSNL